jgi:hypothetical protein
MANDWPTIYPLILQAASEEQQVLLNKGKPTHVVMYPRRWYHRDLRRGGMGILQRARQRLRLGEQPSVELQSFLIGEHPHVAFPQELPFARVVESRQCSATVIPCGTGS